MISVIRIHAIPLSDNDGGRAATLTAADLAVTVKQTNQYFLPAGIQFMFEVFGRGRDGRLWQNDYPAATPDGWTGWNSTAPGRSPSGSPTALSHNADSVQVFALDAGSAQQTTYWGDLDA